MNMMLVDKATGLKYMLQPSTKELEAGIIAYDPVQHAHLWDYITVDSATYINQPDLVDWDSDIDEWNPVFMGQWPFGNPFPELGLLQREVLDCLDRLDSDLDFEEWVMDQEEVALDDADDDFDDDDDDVDDESEDEGYITDEESYSEDDNEWGNFGLAPMLMNILL